MKKRYIGFLPVFILSSAILLQSYSSGPAANNTRATGAPGDGANTCVTCHNSGGHFGPLDVVVEVKDAQGTSVAEYLPDSDYTVSVTVNHGSGTPAGFGFQMICLKTEGNKNVPGWSSPSPNAKLSTSAGRNYVEHKRVSTSNIFTVQWKAPQVGTGNVKFYIGANAVNGNGSNIGDNARLTSVELTEVPTDTIDTVSGITLAGSQMAHWHLYPNPVHDDIHLRNVPLDAVWYIHDARGVEIQSLIYTGQPIDLSALPRGQYFMRMENLPGIQRFIKL